MIPEGYKLKKLTNREITKNFWLTHDGGLVRAKAINTTQFFQVINGETYRVVKIKNKNDKQQQ